MPFQGCGHFCRVDSSSNYFSSQSLNSVMSFCIDRASFLPSKGDNCFTVWSSCLLSCGLRLAMSGYSHPFFSVFTFLLFVHLLCPPSPYPITVLLSFYRFQHTYESGNSLWPESSGRDGVFCLFSPFFVRIDDVTERLEVDQLFILPIVLNCVVQQYRNMLLAYMEQYCSDARIRALYQFQYSFSEFKKKKPRTD